MSVTLDRPAYSTLTKNRLLGIDAVRYAGALAIIMIHMLAIKEVSYTINADSIITQICRFAVPFFFISGGFFLGRKSIPRPALAIRQIAWRIGPVFLSWVIVYLLILPDSIPSTISLKYVVSLFATGGPAYHLWFLPTFALCMMVVAVSARYLSWKYLFTLAGVLYVVGLLVGSYAGLLSSSGHSTAAGLSVARGGPFFGTIFVLFGVWLAKSGWRPSLSISITLIVSGIILHLSEAYILNLNHMNQFTANDFLFGTLVLGAGTFLLALHLPSSNTLVKLAAVLGKYTLGIYAVHLLIVLAFRAAFNPSGLATKLDLSVVVLVVATLVTLGLARMKPTRFLVS